MWDFSRSAPRITAKETTTPEQDRAARKAKLDLAKQEREEDAVQAMKDREAERIAVLAKTQRLRAARLEREARLPQKKGVSPVVERGSPEFFLVNGTTGRPLPTK